MSFRTNAFLLSGLLALSACSPSAGTGVTPTPPTNISGDYTGTVTDSVGGAMPATALLAQHGSTVGGTLSTTAGGATTNAAFSVAITSGNAVSGTIVQDLPGGVTCTFSTTGTYSTSTAQLAGSYTAVTGCSGQHGTYSLTQQCTDTVTNTGDKRPALGVPAC
ncbi:MAG: hypothetical protein M3R30_01240 [Candidatus Eremiobacteraeota bacterium]|nr:hypothetical protein [Candidatus Eremiobacteraeota bacterium]